MKTTWIIIAMLLPMAAFSQTDMEKAMQAGNDFYKQKQYSQASAEYRKVMNAEPDNITAGFNQANALYQQNKKVEAATLLTALAGKSTDAVMRSMLFYNKGVILSKQENLTESIDAYKNALRNNPSDTQARQNLQLALSKLKKQSEQKKKQDDQKKKDQEKKPQSKMSPKEAEQRLKLLQQKEKETQQKMQKENAKEGGSQTKDW